MTDTQESTNGKTSFLGSRPNWFSSIPVEFWKPNYFMHRLLNSSPANNGLGRVTGAAPTLLDWYKKGNIKDALINISIAVSAVLFTWHFLFVLL
jgi:hypothetical protein